MNMSARTGNNDNQFFTNSSLYVVCEPIYGACCYSNLKVIYGVRGTLGTGEEGGGVKLKTEVREGPKNATQ